MCGITGILSQNNRLVTQQRIKEMTDALIHRGPEGEGFYINTGTTVALGHRRLCVIDLSGAAAQPMQYAQDCHIVYNGELYNYIELKKNLQDKGYTFSTRSDTEVIAAAYVAYGRDCLSLFDGMFSFAIWNAREETLFAARDRFGEKPFYYFLDEEQLLFASEIKAVWKGGIAKEINEAMLYNFLTIGYTANPANPAETFYTNIQKLPAASFLFYSLQTHTATVEKYWQLRIDERDNTDKGSIEEFTALFTESIQKRLRSDVAIGTSLSGGLDSSAIVAFCAAEESMQYTHKCFTAVFPGFEKDEEAQAAAVAAEYSLQHYRAEVATNDLPGQIELLMQYHDEPVASAGALAQYAVYRTAKQQGITVLLDGQGADEVLAGYHKYYKWQWQQLYAQRRLGKSGELRLANALDINEKFDFKNKAAALFPHFAAAMLQTATAKKAYRHPGLNRDFAFTYKNASYYQTPLQFDLNSALYFDTVVYGLEELLRLADRSSMANAVEVRLPFLSHKLVEFLFTLPPQYKIREGRTKWLLRAAADARLPSAVVWRRDKTGFEPPQEKWMTDPHTTEAIQAGKAVLVKEGILNPSVSSKRVQPHGAYAAEPFDWRYWMASMIFP